MQVAMTEIKPPSASFGRLRMGGYKDADDDDDVLGWYQRLHVTHVLCMAAEFTPPAAPGIIIAHMPIADDEPQADLFGILSPAVQFVEDALHQQSSTVLIHCRNGASRAVCVTLAVLVKVYNYCLVDAYHYVQHLRKKMQILDAFQDQLTAWCRSQGLPIVSES